jgi:hypothetical protein
VKQRHRALLRLLLDLPDGAHSLDRSGPPDPSSVRVPLHSG